MGSPLLQYRVNFMQNNMDIKNLLEKIKLKDIIYPLITVLFFVVILTVFILDTGFITQNINKAFYVPDPSEIESRMVKIDLENYYVVAGKLGLSTAAPAVVPQEQVAPQEVVPQQPVAPVVPVVDKATLTISVFNTTTTKGAAAAIKKDLETAGFKVGETGNQTPALDITQVKVKSAVNGSQTIEELKQAIVKKYPSATVVVDDSIAVDVVVLIGKQ